VIYDTRYDPLHQECSWVANSPLVLSHDMIDTSHQIESGGNVHDIMTHPGSFYDWSLRAFARKRAVDFLFGLLSFFPVKLFYRFTLFPCIFRQSFQRFFMTPLIALAEHAFSSPGFPALFERVDALHRMIWHDMALAGDTQPFFNDR